MTVYSISPNAPAVYESNGFLIFTITRTGSNLPAETLYVSTTQTEGFANNNDYSPLNNFPLVFAAGQASLLVPVSIVNDLSFEPDEKFALIVQSKPSDLLTTFLAKTT